MSKERDALKLALECIEAWDRGGNASDYWRDRFDAITAIKEALASEASEQPAQQQEPVACQPRGLIDIGRIFTPEKAEEPKPVAWKKKGAFNFCNQPPVDVEKWIPLYTTPPHRKPLTDEQIEELCWTELDRRLLSFARAIEAAHGIKG